MLVVAVIAAGAGAIAGCGEEQGGPISVPAELRDLRPPPSGLSLGAAVDGNAARSDRAYLRALLATFGLFVPENAMSWEALEPDEGRFDFEEADHIVDLAERTDRRVRGGLVWDELLPEWLADRSWSRRELREVLVRFVDTVVRRYRGRITKWVVVNEPFDQDGSLTRNLWTENLGERYIDIAFRTAHRADPDAELILNEIGAEYPGPKQAGLVRLAKRLRSRGVPVDTVGLQNHVTISEYPSRRLLRRVFDRIQPLRAAITEMDVEVGEEPWSSTVARQQAAAYVAASKACLQAPNCDELTVWGVTDRYSWKGEEQRPLLFANDGEPKLAAEALLRTLDPRDGSGR